MVSDALGSGVRWSCARRFLPVDLDQLAVDSKALERRRGVDGGEGLLRTLLLCALPSTSLARAAALARDAGLARVNSTAYFKRLAGSEQFLKSLFVHTLRHAVEPSERFGAWRLLAIDATVLCGPGATGTDQRLHVAYDLGKGLPAWVELTGAEGGESLTRHLELGEGDLILGDRGYGHSRGLLHAIRQNARFLVRFELHSLRLLDENGGKLWPEAAEARVGATGVFEMLGWLPDHPEPLRILGERNPEGQVVWFITNLSPQELPKEGARKLYSRRWQIELFFKRMKSLLKLDELPTREGPTARPWIWAKLVFASLAVLVAHERFSPWGCPPEAETGPLGTVRTGRKHSGANPSGTSTQTQARKTPKNQTKNAHQTKTIHTVEA